MAGGGLAASPRPTCCSRNRSTGWKEFELELMRAPCHDNGGAGGVLDRETSTDGRCTPATFGHRRAGHYPDRPGITADAGIWHRDPSRGRGETRPALATSSSRFDPLVDGRLGRRRAYQPALSRSRSACFQVDRLPDRQDSRRSWPSATPSTSASGHRHTKETPVLFRTHPGTTSWSRRRGSRSRNSPAPIHPDHHDEIRRRGESLGRNFIEALGKVMRRWKPACRFLDQAGPRRRRRRCADPAADADRRPALRHRAGRCGWGPRVGAWSPRPTGCGSWFVAQIGEPGGAARPSLVDAPVLDGDLLRRAKHSGLVGRSQIAARRPELAGENGVRFLRERLGIHPVYKTVDTCAAEFEAKTPYHYSSY